MVNIFKILICYIAINSFLLLTREFKQNPIKIEDDTKIDDYILNLNIDEKKIESSEKALIIKKDNNEIIYKDKSYYLSPDILLCKDQSNYYYLFANKAYYKKNKQNKDDNIIESLKILESFSLNLEYKGFIREKEFKYKDPVSPIQKDEIIIYGKSGDKLYFIYIKEKKSYSIEIPNIGEQISCKLIRGSRYACSYFVEDKIYVSTLLLKYKSSSDRELTILQKLQINNQNYDNLILFETDHYYYKILCYSKKTNNEIKCNIIYTFVEYYVLLGTISKNLELKNSYSFNKDSLYKTHECYLSIFNGEFLSCCGGKNNINCFRNNIENFNLISIFSINLKGNIDNVIIKNVEDYTIISYKNETSSKNYLYNYYIYPPKCKNYFKQINSFQELEINFNELFERDTNTKYYIQFDKFPTSYGIIKIGESQIKKAKLNIELNPEIANLYFISNSYEEINLEIFYDIIIEETYSSKCKISLNINKCYKSCKGCTMNNNNSNETHHNCKECKEEDNYYPYSEKPNNCYTKKDMEDNNFQNWYLNKKNKKFETIESVPMMSNDTGCEDTSLFIYEGMCIKNCPYGTFESQNKNGNNICENCYPNCEDCIELGNNTDMKCISCSEDKIKNEQNCYFIYDKVSYSFYIHNNSLISSCLESFDKYIIENTYECINKTEEGYFLLNNSTGLISQCHFSCKTCSNFRIGDNSNCLDCANEYYPIFDEGLNNCYSIETISEGYFLDKINTPIYWKKCYENCEECYDVGNSTNMNCISCKDLSYNSSINYYFLLTDNGNCVRECKSNFFWTLDGDCVDNCPNGTYIYSLNRTCLKNCPNFYELNEEQNECIEQSYEKISSNDFKNLFLNNMNDFTGMDGLINGSDFLAVVLSSNDMDPIEQVKKGISGVNLNNCTEQLKEHYNISKDENLIILNMEMKRNETKINEEKNPGDNSLNVGKQSEILVYDKSGRELNLSICNQFINILKYVGDLQKELDIDSAIDLANKGIDKFNPKDDYFNNICCENENDIGKDISINDRRSDIFKNVSFCDEGCSYNGMNYELMIADCTCDSSAMKINNTDNKINEGKEKVDFNSLKNTVIAGLDDFNFDVIFCYNLIFNVKIFTNNIGFYCMFIMIIFQIICFCIYIYKKLNPIKYFMLIFNKLNQKISPFFSSNKFDNKSIYKKFGENKFKKSSKKPENNIKRKLVIKNSNKRLKNMFYSKKNKINFKKKNDKNMGKIKGIMRENMFPSKQIKLETENNDDYNIKSIHSTKRNDKINFGYKSNKIIKSDIISKNNLETTEEKKNFKNTKDILTFYRTDEDFQDMDYKYAIFYDKRSCLKMYWSFLVDTQIILGTFCTKNYFNLLVIKISFLIYTFQISLFLNALFYTDEYISNAYYNDGVLDFVSGLPKSFYSFIATLLISNLLRMLSNNASELKRLIKHKRNQPNYENLVNIKLKILRKKLIVYFFLVFVLDFVFLYYITAFCVVYKYSQKYFIFGFLESFAMDSALSIIICIFLSLFRYIAIKRKLKCFYFLANIISAFL